MILVIGDIIVDEFIMGDVSRISPEAPVPVVNVQSIDRRLGGSANVVRNLHSLGNESAMMGVIGDDEAGQWVLTELQAMDSDAQGVLMKKNARPTAIKSRVIARHQQVVRFDREWCQPLHGETRLKLKAFILEKLPFADAVILSDYGKGVLTHDFLLDLMPLLQGKIIAIDPKPAHTDAYQHATLITPNLVEAAEMAGMAAINSDEQVLAIAQALHQRLHLQYTLITRSEKGMSLYDGKQLQHIPTAACDVFDVTGAGDTVIAVLTSCLVRGDSILEAVKIANRAAGVVVAKVGTATANWQEIEEHV
ncbi:MAG: D-glycero-beta-D-manno-heptose-7-phosphate kinase [Mariprofundaceae bacterium]|nr:D-glycero-beta-D-manno-heptose-7-phosphate kinase [Mariprofundaceae bacterium]